MADSRKWLHDRLVQRAPLVDLLPEGVDGIRAFRSFTEVPKEKPFIVTRSSGMTPLIKDDGKTLAAETRHQVWAHDRPGSYLKIDAVLAEVWGVVEMGASEGDIIRGDSLDLSEDLEDPEMGTILRWCRFRVAHRLQ